jgi:competence protein ComEC
VLALAVGWAIGIAVGGTTSMPWPAIASGLLATVAAAILTRSDVVRLVALALVAVFCGVARTTLASPPPPSDPLADHVGQVVLVGEVLDGPVMRGGRFEVDLEVESVVKPGPQSSAVTLPSPGPRALLRWSSSSVRFGDRVEARGRLTAPRSRPGWPLADILARRQVFWVLDAGFVRTRESAQPSFWTWLARARDALDVNLRLHLPETEASLVAGMVLGARPGLPPDLRATLATTSITHLTAVSGLNVALVAGGVLVVGRRLLGAQWAIIPTLLAVWIYAVLVGAPPSALRAAAMLTAWLAAQALGRLPDPVVGLALAVATLLGWDPSLAFDLGFQLSVAATAGLVLLTPTLDDDARRLPKLVRAPLTVTLAAQLATLPIILGTFQTVSMASVPANLLAAPLVLPITWLGAALSMAAPVPFLGELLAWPTWACARAMLNVAGWLALLPGAAVATGRPSPLFAACWFAMLMCWVGAGSADVRTLGIRPGFLRASAALAAAGAVTLAVLPNGQTDAVEISLLDVPAGAAFVRSPAGRTAVLVTADDAFGLTPSVGQRLRGLATRPDLVVGPAGSTAVTQLLARYPADRVLEGGGPGESDLTPGTRIVLGEDVTIEVVDVRTVDDRVVLDLAVLAGDVAVWLPGPGRPSERWSVIEDSNRTVLRLPTTAAAWLREPMSRPWHLVVGQQMRGSLALTPDLPYVEQRQARAVEIAVAVDDLTVRTERPDVGR